MPLGLAKDTIEKTCRQFDIAASKANANANAQKTDLPSKVTINSNAQNYRQPINRRPLNRNKISAKALPTVSNKTNKSTGIINNMKNKLCEKCGNHMMLSMRLCPQCGNKSFASSIPSVSLINSVINYIKRIF